VNFWTSPVAGEAYPCLVVASEGNPVEQYFEIQFTPCADECVSMVVLAENKYVLVAYRKIGPTLRPKLVNRQQSQ
jgi:hypothetical protein